MANLFSTGIEVEVILTDGTTTERCYPAAGQSKACNEVLEALHLEFKHGKLYPEAKPTVVLTGAIALPCNVKYKYQCYPEGVAPSQEQLQEMIAQQVQQQLAQFGVLRDFFLHILDYSEGVISTAPSTANFKNMLVHQYSDRLDGEHGPMLWCMLLQMRLPKSLVIGSHLWKRAWHQHMWVLDLPAEEIDSIRNGVLLFKPIEWAFDTSRLCFELDDFGHYVPHLLDGRLQDTKLLDKLEELIQPQVLDSELKAFLSATLKVRDTDNDLTFGHLPTYWLTSAPGKEAPAPWSRVLEFQARRASLKAAELHWPHEPVTFITGNPYAARAGILKWFAHMEEQAAAAGDPVAVVQQLP